MKASAKIRYGLQLMAELAKQQGRGPVQVADIARRQELPPKYLHVLMGSLKAAGLVKVLRGPAGGCELARTPGRISVLEVVEALEGRGPASEASDPTPGARAVAELWERSAEAWREVLRQSTLADLAGRLDALDLGSRDYSI
jgi:Rrf2 family protein